MLMLLLVSALISHGVWAHPLTESHAQAQSELPSHIVIVTPQAQVHLDSGFRYDSQGPFIHHLSPLARYAGSQEDTIVYVPSSGIGGRVAPIAPVPIETFQSRQDYNINDFFNGTGGFFQSVSNNSFFPQGGYQPPAQSPSQPPAQSAGYNPPQFPGFQIPAFQVPGYQPPAVQPPNYQPPAVQIPTYQPPALQIPSYQPPSSQPTSTQSPPTQSPSTQSPPTQSPPSQSPSYQPPAFNPPAYQPPALSPPSYTPPALQGPSYQPPALQLPPLNPPSYQPPTLQGPSYQPPSVQAPSYQPPALQAPSYTQSALQLQPQPQPLLQQQQSLEQTQPLLQQTQPLPLLSTNEPRHFYAVAPSAVPHLVDFVHTPMYVGPVSTIRARSIPETIPASQAVPLPLEIKKSDGIPLTETKLDHPEALPLTQNDYGRFLEASNALKEDNNNKETPLAEHADILATVAPLLPSNNIADAQPLLAALDGGLAPELAHNGNADKVLLEPIATPTDAIMKAA